MSAQVSQLSKINAIALPCGPCRDFGHHGAKHSVRQVGGRVTLRCRGCGGGYVIDASALPPNHAPPELVIQAICNLVVNRHADVLPPDPGAADEEPT